MYSPGLISHCVNQSQIAGDGGAGRGDVGVVLSGAGGNTTGAGGTATLGLDAGATVGPGPGMVIPEEPVPAVPALLVPTGSGVEATVGRSWMIGTATELSPGNCM